MMIELYAETCGSKKIVILCTSYLHLVGLKIDKKIVPWLKCEWWNYKVICYLPLLHCIAIDTLQCNTAQNYAVQFIWNYYAASALIHYSVTLHRVMLCSYFIRTCYRWKCFCDMKAIIQVYIVDQIIKSFVQCCLWETCHKVLWVNSSPWRSKFFHYNCVRHVFFLSCEITRTFTSQFSLLW